MSFNHKQGVLVHLSIIIVIVVICLSVYRYIQVVDISVKTDNDTGSSTVNQINSYVNDGQQIPKIYSINPTRTDHINTLVTIKGIYLNGFEGGTAVWFENNLGESGVIEASSYVPIGATTLTFKLPNELCIKNMGESGLPCPSYMGMRPGVYKVYVQAWGISSNKLDFVISQ
ncbi:MAG: hypothetical protein WCG07_02945 [Candidatus Taylorbacteria bacterium]